MRKKSYHIITIGCQMNKSDSERIAGYLERLGFVWTDKRDKASLVVVTTCGVRQSAEDRVYMLLPKIKKENPQVLTVVTGCLSGRADVQGRLKESVDVWLPIVDLAKLGMKLKNLVPPTPSPKPPRPRRCGATPPWQGGDGHSPSGRGRNSGGSVGGYLKINPKYESKVSAFVPIGNGCDNFCAYCVVPYARGREVYRPAGEILSEVRGLVKKGYKEIFLIAQNVNSYRCNFQFFPPQRDPARAVANPNFQKNSRLDSLSLVDARRAKSKVQNSKLASINFAGLLKQINDIPGNFWIRFATSHPKDMSEELIRTIGECEKVCHQIHLPVQAGDNEVLRRMNRKYTREHYLGLIKKIKRALPDASISTDIIVGFPGEIKKQFQNSEKLFREVKFDQAFISQYSPRPGTVAAKMIDNISKVEKKRREEALMKILRRTALANNQSDIGKIVEVLIDASAGSTGSPQGGSARGGKKGEYYLGKTKNGKNVRITAEKNGKLKVGDFVLAKIISVKDFGMLGAVEK